MDLTRITVTVVVLVLGIAVGIVGNWLPRPAKLGARGVALALALLVVLDVSVTLGTTTSSDSAASSGGPSPGTAPSQPANSTPVPAVWNHATLTLDAGMNANLDSQSPDFGKARSMNWPPGNVAYDKSSDNLPGNTLFLANAPDSTVALGTGGTWNYGTCAHARYAGGDANSPLGPNIAPGHGLCFHAPSGRYILLVVRGQDERSITLDVTSWALG